MAQTRKHGDWARFFEAKRGDLVAAWVKAIQDGEETAARQFPPAAHRRMLTHALRVLARGLDSEFTPAHHLKLEEQFLKEGYLEAFTLQEIGAAYRIFLELVWREMNSFFARRSPERRAEMRRKLARVLIDSFAQIAGTRVALDQEELRESEARFRTMIETAGDAILLADARTGQIEYANGQAAHLFGAVNGELAGLGIGELVAPRKQQWAYRELARQQGEPQAGPRTMRLSLRRIDGQRFEAEFSVVRLERRDRSQFLVVMRDITKELAYTQTLHEHTKQLKLINDVGRSLTATFDRDEILRRIVADARNVVPCGAASLLLADDAGRLVFQEAVGPRGPAVKQYVLEPGQGVAGWVVRNGRTAVIADAHQDERFDARIELEVRFPVRTLLCVPLQVEQRVLGALELLNRRGGPFTETDVELTEAFASFAAIALDKALLFAERAQLRSQLLQAEAATHAGRLASTIAQEMIDPITILKNHLTIWRQDATQGHNASLGIMDEELHRLHAIIRQLIDYSNATADVARPTPLHLVIADLLASLRPEIDAAGASLRIEQPSRLPWVTAVPNQITLALANLLRRALHVTPRNGTVVLRLTRHRAQVRVAVRDGGEPLSRQQIDTLFDPTAVQRGILAKGLNLYIASAVVRHHGGELRGRGHRGRGTTFSFELPVNAAEAAYA